MSILQIKIAIAHQLLTTANVELNKWNKRRIKSLTEKLTECQATMYFGDIFCVILDAVKNGASFKEAESMFDDLWEQTKHGTEKGPLSGRFLEYAKQNCDS